MQGKVSVILQDKNGKTIEEYDHNLVTNGANNFYQTACNAATYKNKSQGIYSWSNYAAGTCARNLGYMCDYDGDKRTFNIQNALGGIWLFDDTLTQTTANVALTQNSPTIVGFADNRSGDDYPAFLDIPDSMGVFDSGESGSISNGYKFVWKWSGNKLINKSIHSLALTNVMSAANPFVSLYDQSYISASNPSLRAYYFRQPQRWSDWSTDAGGYGYDEFASYGQIPFYMTRNHIYAIDYQATTINIYQWSITGSGMVSIDSETPIATLDISNIEDITAGFGVPHLGYDGYAYWCNAVGDTGNKHYYYLKIDLDDFSMSINEIILPVETDEFIIHDGYAYFTNSNAVYKFNIENGTYEYTEKYGGAGHSIGDVISPLIGGKYMFVTRRMTDYGGIIPFDFSDEAEHAAPTSIYYNSTANQSVCLGQYLKDLDPDSELLTYGIQRITECTGYDNWAISTSRSLHIRPYLATVFNLLSPIQKNSSDQTLVITYEVYTEAVAAEN